MEEREYVELQCLLVKYRVNCLKDYSNMSMPTSLREKARKQVGYIDEIRNGMSFIIKERREEIACLKESKSK